MFYRKLFSIRLRRKYMKRKCVVVVTMVLIVLSMCIGQKIETPIPTSPPVTTSPPTTSPPTTPPTPPAKYHIAVSIRCDSPYSDDEIIAILSRYMILTLPCAYVLGCPTVGMICEGYATEDNVKQISGLEFVSSVEIIATGNFYYGLNR